MKEKICKSCVFFEKLYMRFAYSHFETEHYCCAKSEELTLKESYCDCWQEKEKLPPDLSSARLAAAEEDIKAIKKYLRQR